MTNKEKATMDANYSSGFIPQDEEREHPGSGAGNQLVGFVPPGFTARDVLDGKAAGWNKKQKPPAE